MPKSWREEIPEAVAATAQEWAELARSSICLSVMAHRLARGSVQREKEHSVRDPLDSRF
jgi:hypothetical protein